MGKRRKLSAREYSLVVGLISRSDLGEDKKSALIESARDAPVEELSDGGMGSLRFFWGGCEIRKFGRKIAEREFFDSDGVEISVAINLDQLGDLYELDLWKVDFSKVKVFPSI